MERFERQSERGENDEDSNSLSLRYVFAQILIAEKRIANGAKRNSPDCTFTTQNSTMSLRNSSLTADIGVG